MLVPPRRTPSLLWTLNSHVPCHKYRTRWRNNREGQGLIPQLFLFSLPDGHGFLPHQGVRHNWSPIFLASVRSLTFMKCFSHLIWQMYTAIAPVTPPRSQMTKPSGPEAQTWFRLKIHISQPTSSLAATTIQHWEVENFPQSLCSGCFFF